jgi:23S rRNA pseudouridine1911/1915/1917 synthase
VIELRVPHQAVGRRIDAFVTDAITDASRSAIKRAILSGAITLNGLNVKPSHRLASGEEIRWVVEPARPCDTVAQDIPLEVLFADEDIVVLNKTSGMVVHPGAGHPDGTLVNALLFQFGDLSSVGDVKRPGIVHRLDKDTSGVMVVSRSDRAHRHLADQFRDHTIERTYHALIYAPKLADSGTFDTLHGRHPTDRVRFSSRVKKGKTAVTHFKTLEYLDGKHRLVRCRLETGRTHQIRVHFSDASAPLIGDAQYAPKRVAKTKLIDRQALHAKTLGFIHIDGSHHRWESPYPADFEKALESLRADTEET